MFIVAFLVRLLVRGELSIIKEAIKIRSIKDGLHVIKRLISNRSGNAGKLINFINRLTNASKNKLFSQKILSMDRQLLEELNNKNISVNRKKEILDIIAKQEEEFNASKPNEKENYLGTRKSFENMQRVAVFNADIPYYNIWSATFLPYSSITAGNLTIFTIRGAKAYDFPSFPTALWVKFLRANKSVKHNKPFASNFWTWFIERYGKYPTSINLKTPRGIFKSKSTGKLNILAFRNDRPFLKWAKRRLITRNKPKRFLKRKLKNQIILRTRIRRRRN